MRYYQKKYEDQSKYAVKACDSRTDCVRLDGPAENRIPPGPGIVCYLPEA